MSIQSRPLLAIQLLISGGIIIVCVGLLMIISSNVTYDNSIGKTENPDIVEIPWVFDITYSGKGGYGYGYVNATIKFSSPDVFSVYNTVSSTVNATVFPTNSIKHLYFIIPEEHENLTNSLITPSQFEYRVNQSRSFHSLIETQKIDPTHFNGFTYFNFTQPRTITVNAIIQFNNSDYYVSPIFSSPFMIESHLSKIQANTDRDIQKQNLESEKTNGHVEGLTVVIIGLIPIGFAIEFFIERHFWDKENRPKRSFASIHSRSPVLPRE